MALGTEPMARLGLGRMTAIVLGDLALNGIVLGWLTTWLQRRGLQLGTRGAAQPIRGIEDPNPRGPRFRDR